MSVGTPSLRVRRETPLTLVPHLYVLLVHGIERASMAGLREVCLTNGTSPSLLPAPVLLTNSASIPLPPLNIQ